METIQSAPELERSYSPLSPAGLVDLYFRPRRFFSNALKVDSKIAVLVAAYLAGVVSVMDRIDRNIMRSEIGHAPESWGYVSSWLLTSWKSYWITVTLTGIIAAVFVWYVGGWWYKKRLQWSGAGDVEPVIARRIYVLQGLVSSCAIVLAAVVQTVKYGSYIDAWQANDPWVMALAVFLLWSCWTSYVGATTACKLSRWRARIWFLILPALLYLAVGGIIGTLYLLYSGQSI